MGILLLAVISRLGSSLQLWMPAHTHAHAFCNKIWKASLCVYITSSPFILRLEILGVQPLCKYVNDLLVPWLNDKCSYWLHLEGWTEPLITFQILQKDLTVKHKQHFLILCCCGVFCCFFFFSSFPQTDYWLILICTWAESCTVGWKHCDKIPLNRTENKSSYRPINGTTSQIIQLHNYSWAADAPPWPNRGG